MNQPNFNQYLESTTLCDSTHPAIISKAQELTKNAASPQKKAMNIFYFVRDEIKFMMNYEDDKASDTLRKQFGDCGTKTNLQVALLRSLEIPARYHVAALRKECLKGIVSKLYYRLTPKLIPFHPWCEVFLSDNWIACDTLIDKPLINVIYRHNIYTKDQLPTFEWDGKTDLNTMKFWMHEDKGIFSSLEELVKNIENLYKKPPPEPLVRFLTKMSNKHTDKLRKES